VDTERLYFLATQQTLATVGVPLTKEQYIELFLLAVKRSSFCKEECLVIEDSERGLMAAKAAGIRCIVVPSEFTRGSSFAGA
jgi:HAD superfamily hydrolase (TIGR01509 family)